EACDGEHITVKGFATNCDTERAADVTVILSDATGEIGRKTCPAVAPGGVCELGVPVTFHCTPGTPVTYSVAGFASNSCGNSDTKNITCQIPCLSRPCLSPYTSLFRSEACDGEHITVKGFATNCDTERAADVTVILSDASGEIGRKTCPAVAPGGVCEL